MFAPPYPDESFPEPYDIAIIGGGVVGLSILRSATLAGWRCALVEAEPDLLTKASGSNSGIACTGVDAEVGTLERALIRESISEIRVFCRQFNIPKRECGSLVCLWPWDDECEGENSIETCDTTKDASGTDARLREVASESWDAGDTNAVVLPAAKALEMEPSLNSEIRGAVHIPGEIVLDPWLFPVALASNARENGAVIHTAFEYDPSLSFFDEAEKVWTLIRSNIGREEIGTNGDNPKSIRASVVVNATGVQSDLVQSNTPNAPEPTWKAKPRRGQYRIFSPTSAENDVQLTRPIQPVPTPRTKGIFVFSTVYDQIVVGPTAEEQESRSDTTPSEDVAEALTRHVKRVLPKLRCEEDCYVGEYVGIRPATTQRDYQITTNSKRNWVTAAGIRSTGLTASLGIGRYVTRLLRSMDVLPQSAKCSSDMQQTPLPDVGDLVQQFHDRNDGCVVIHGFVYRVTHPLTRLGWEARKPQPDSI